MELRLNSMHAQFMCQGHRDQAQPCEVEIKLLELLKFWPKIYWAQFLCQGPGVQVQARKLRNIACRPFKILIQITLTFALIGFESPISIPGAKSSSPSSFHLKMERHLTIFFTLTRNFFVKFWTFWKTLHLVGKHSNRQRLKLGPIFIKRELSVQRIEPLSSKLAPVYW